MMMIRHVVRKTAISGALIHDQQGGFANASLLETVVRNNNVNRERTQIQ
jgi:hypothetical protein